MPPPLLIFLLFLTPWEVRPREPWLVKVTEGEDAHLPCLTDPPDNLLESLAWYQGAQSEPFLVLSHRVPGLGLQKGPQGVWLSLFNISEQMGGFYLCHLGPQSSQLQSQSGWTVSVNGSGELFRWNASDLGGSGCDIGNRSVQDPRGPPAYPPASRIYVWKKNYPEIWEPEPLCATPRAQSNRSLSQDLTVAPGSTVQLPCGVPPGSTTSGPISWTRVHPKTRSVLLLSLNQFGDDPATEKWALGILKGGTILLLPRVTAKSAGLYHCRLGNRTLRMELQVTAQSGPAVCPEQRALD
ncbi:B-lymphocyte antigen CD19 [Erinaceus europaeus]|uniref:B-lymphocyte antigen CD19 n=1 Tax=Erinaceus europaeus TaxID=9365 RepID=A0ABM3W0I9_ERIEU|nr:B-lymphocyte antigen CD19 [Erinaceus europaeus]